MIRNHNKLKKIIDDCFVDLPLIDNKNNNTNVPFLIKRIANKFPKNLNKLDIAIMDQLCKKIHVSNELNIYYDENWKKIQSKTLPINYLKLLSILLLSYGIIFLEEKKNYAFKYYNSYLLLNDKFTLNNNLNFLEKNFIQKI